MPVVDKNQLKIWFKNLAKPVQEQFWNWMDSFYHKSEPIPKSAVENLTTDLAKKADLVGGVVPASQLPFSVNTSEVIAVGEISATENTVTLSVHSSGTNAVRINGVVLTRTFPNTFNFTPVTEGSKFLIIYAINDSGIFRLAEGVEDLEAVEPEIPVGALFVRRILINSAGADVELPSLNGFREKVEDDWKAYTFYAPGEEKLLPFTTDKKTSYIIKKATNFDGDLLLAGMKSKITDSDNWWPGKEFTVFNQTSNNLILVAGYTGTGVTFNIASNVTIPAGKFVKFKVSADLSSLEVLQLSGDSVNIDGKQDRLQDVTGNIGVGKTDASATEKLDIAGRTKSDGIVINETSSAILPKEIKFKDGKFKAALADGVEKSIAFEGDVGTNLLKSYTHSSNQIIRIQSIDYSTSIATCVSPHGLTGIVQVGIFADYLNNIDENFNNIWRDLRTIPWEYLTADVYVQAVDSVTLKICNSAGTAIAVNSTTSGYNTGTSHSYNANNLSNIFWHIEVLQPFNITDIPINNKRIMVEIIGGMKIKNQRYLAFDIYDLTNIKKNNLPFGTEWNMNFHSYVPLSTFNYGQTNKQSVLFQQKIFIHASTRTAIIDLKESALERSSGTYGLYLIDSAESRYQKNFFPFEKNNGIASVKSSDPSQGFFCNGTIINVYKV